MSALDSIINSQEFDLLAAELCQAGRFFAERGWSPATSSNYSALLPDRHIAITRTGVNKYEISREDIIVVDKNGHVVAPVGARSSAETLIHTAIYALRPKAKACLHTHSPLNTRLSLKFKNQGQLQFSGYELQKGLAGNSTHKRVDTLPILENSQDMNEFTKSVEKLLRETEDIYGFLISGHGLYTWGESVSEARRHVETYEFLMSCTALELTGI